MKGMEERGVGGERGDFEESSSYMSLSRVFSQSGLLGNPEQHKQTDETLHDERTFFSFC